MPRCLAYHKGHLAENPLGLIVTWRATKDTTKLGRVVGSRRREQPAGTMLQVRHFNGEEAGEVCAGAVRVLEPGADWYENPD